MRTSLLFAPAYALALMAGCHSNFAATTRSPTHTDAIAATIAKSDAAPDDREVFGLPRALHDARMTEVVPDSTGQAALTLDASGGVRLWPNLHAGADTIPIVVALQEPAAMSLARAGETAFVAAFVDTAGAGRVVHIELARDQARQTELFEIPAIDPLFELHVLDGGERILALGVDHRVRLYDSTGQALSVLDEPGFIPYQLRVAQTAGGPAAVVAVLVKPVRVQSIALADDRLAIAGEPRQVALDQGPNRNDLAILPGGESVAALRRPKGKTREWWLEIIELESGKRRKIAGEADGFARPRVHLVDDHRALLEAGSGKGFYIDLDAAIEVVAGTVAPKLPAAVTAVELPGSTIDTRMHAVVVNGTRILPSESTLVVDPLADGDHVVLGHELPRPTAVALDEEGERVAWAATDRLFVAGVDGTPPRSIAGPAQTIALALLPDDRMLVVSADGEVTVRSVADGRTLSRVLAFSRSVESAHYDRTRGVVAVQALHRNVPIRVIAVTDGQLGEGHDLAVADVAQWPELARIRDSARERAAKRLGLRLREGHVLRMLPNASGTLIAVLQRAPSGSLRGGTSATVSVHDAATGERLWTRPLATSDSPAWASDADRLALTDAPGVVVVEARTGKALHRQRRG